MANERGKIVDTTYLSVDNAEDRGFIHRDYIAHCLRWSHVCKFLYQRQSWKSARILDVGCGRELPLAKMLYSSKLIPEAYFGVDAGPVQDEDLAKLKGEMARVTKVWDRTNFLELTNADVDSNPKEGRPATIPDALPNLVTCFEVLEHVEPKMMMDMLEHMKQLTTDDATFFISTPCWNRTDCAANHVNEMLYESLGAAFERHGFVIENVWGTFASIRDYEHLLGNEVNSADANQPSPRELFDKLRAYYDTNVLSCIFAPLFPKQSRNCLWKLRKLAGHGTGFNYPIPRDYPKFSTIDKIQKPWSSSSLWEDMAL